MIQLQPTLHHIGGGFNHISRRPDFRNANREETFGNKRIDFGRTFKAPAHLEEPRKYIYADIQKTTLTQANQKQEKAKKKRTNATDPGNKNHMYGRRRKPKESGAMKKGHKDTNQKRRHDNVQNVEKIRRSRRTR